MGSVTDKYGRQKALIVFQMITLCGILLVLFAPNLLVCEIGLFAFGFGS